MEQNNAAGARRRDTRNIVLIAAVVVVWCASYWLMRYVAASPMALVISQFIYVAAPAVGAALSGTIAFRAPSGTRSRLAWSLLSTGQALLALSELAYAWHTLMDGRPSDPMLGMSDVASALAALSFLALIGVSTSSRPRDRGRTARVLIDLVSIGCLAFVFAVRFWIAPMIGTSSPVEIMEAARLSVYSSLGVVVFLGAVFNLRGFGRGPSRLWLRVLRVGLALFGLAVSVFPWWSLSISGAISRWSASSTDLLFLTGYVLIALSAGARLADREANWGWGSSVPKADAVVPGVVASTVAFTALVFIGWAAVSAPHQSAEQAVYFAALFVVTLGLVGRTAINSAEVLRLRSIAETDMVTGSANTRRIDERMAELVSASRRFGEPFAAIIVDLDDFTEINKAHGFVLGDRLLKRVATRLSDTVGSEALFRLAGDKFLVLVRCGSRADADAIARRLAVVAESAEYDGVDARASAGYAVCPDDSVDPSELLGMAESALGWAKYHGKHRVVAHDMDILIALTSQERQLLADRPAQLEVARALAAAADAYDPTNYRHARNVAALSVLFAREIGMDSDQIARIELAAMLHDIGKVAVPLSGSSRASRTDEAAVRRHAELGGFMLESLEVDDVPSWVRSHHERWDGAGYPDGLQGDDIPLASRIIALTDAYDAIVTGGYSRAPRSKVAALQEIDLGLGARFDPVLGERFIAFVGTRGALGWSDEWTAA